MIKDLIGVLKLKVTKTLIIEKYCFQEEKVLEALVLLMDICTLEDNQMIIINGHSLETLVGLMMMFYHISKSQNLKKMEMRGIGVKTVLCLFQMLLKNILFVRNSFLVLKNWEYQFKKTIIQVNKKESFIIKEQLKMG